MTQLATVNGTGLAVGQPEWESRIDLIKRTVAVGHSDAELELFFYQAKRTGLDPLARQIYSIKRGGKATIQVGIDGYRLIADRTGLYAGNDDAVFVEGDKHPESATVTVWKVVGGQRCPFSATARWDEYYPGDQAGQMWRKMPHTMLGKCAEGLALRKAFPAELGGTYVDAEMHQAGRPDNVESTGEIVEGEVVESAPMPQSMAIPPRETPINEHAVLYLCDAEKDGEPCSKSIEPVEWKTKGGQQKRMSAADRAAYTKREYGVQLCTDCAAERAELLKGAA